MNKLSFTKMHGAGNDFILINDLDGKMAIGRSDIAALCERRFGVGADGLMFLRKASNGADVRMVYHNSDGGEAEMCGNGARCFALFARRELDWQKPSLRIATAAGIIEAGFVQNFVRLRMTRPCDWREPVTINTKHGNFAVVHINTGVPHVVVRVSEIDSVDVESLGRELRYHAIFAPAGANVNFFQIGSDATLKLRTYERGVEAETLACGTGVVATALVAEKYHNIPIPVRVRVRGGDVLTVQRDDSNEVYLIGPAVFVFEGKADLEEITSGSSRKLQAN